MTSTIQYVMVRRIRRYKGTCPVKSKVSLGAMALPEPGDEGCHFMLSNAQATRCSTTLDSVKPTVVTCTSQHSQSDVVPGL